MSSNDSKSAAERDGECDTGHLLSCLEFAWNCLTSQGLLEQAKQLTERVDSQRFALSQAGAGGDVVRPAVTATQTAFLANVRHDIASGMQWFTVGSVREIIRALDQFADALDGRETLTSDDDRLLNKALDASTTHAYDLATPPATPVQPTASVEAVDRLDVVIALREWFGGERYARDYEYLDTQMGPQMKAMLETVLASRRKRLATQGDDR